MQLQPTTRLVAPGPCMPLGFVARLAVALFVLLLSASTSFAAEQGETLVEARQLFLAGKYAEAGEIYERLREDEPAEASLGLARCQASIGETELAVEVLEAAAQQSPNAATLPAELARLAFERGDYEAAARWAEAARAIDDDCLPARYIQAELHRARGDLDEANEAYKWFVDYYNGRDVDVAESLLWIGKAAAEYARWNRLSDQFAFLVNELYPDALALEPLFWPAHYESGLLFLEKYNEAEARRSLTTALRINPSSAEVNAALARLELQRFNMDEAKLAIARALEINPRLPAAHRARADWLMANFDFDEALKVLDRARQLNPASEETLGRLAACYVLIDGLPDDGWAGTRFGEVRDEVDARNPRAGLFYHTLASALAERLKFDAAEEFFREATERMPQLVGPRSGLGMMYMRVGNEVEARRLLEESFDIDPFNVRVSNTLKVLDVLDEYETRETDHFIIRYDDDKDRMLVHYVARFLEEEVWPKLTEQLKYAPPEKTLFEFFNQARNTDGHGWFSARMVGLPYIGTVGACAGKMVALASPTAMKSPYNWARVVEHEFVHVINLQQTNFNIPHWYTEALAVLNEPFPRPQVWNELLLERVPKGDLFNLATINLGFVRPKSSLDWQMAYCQAELYAEYMLREYGDDALTKMLDAYADNLNTESALERSFGVSQEAFEEGYRAYLDEVVAQLKGAQREPQLSFAELERAQREKPDDARLTARLAQAHLDRKAYPEARRLAERARQLDPQEQLAAYVLARLRLLIGETQQAVTLLDEALDRSSPDEDLLNLLAGLRLRAEMYDEAAELYELAAQRDPYSIKWQQALARVYLRAGNDDRLRETLVRVADMDADNVAVRKKLAQMALAADDYDEASTWALRALQIDVMDAATHRLAAEAHAGAGRLDRAIEEYQFAIELDPDEPALRLALGDLCIQAQRTDEARQVLEALLELHPDYPGAKLLLESLDP